MDDHVVSALSNEGLFRIGEKEPLVLTDPKEAFIRQGADDVIVHLKVYGLASKVPKSRLKALLDKALLDNRTTTLWVDVRESNNPHHQLSVPLPVDLFRDLILAKVPKDPEY